MMRAIMLSTLSPCALHSGIVTSRFVATCEFYFELFGFTPVEITPDYALLGRADGSRLAVLHSGGEGQPAALTRATCGDGVWLSFESDDVDALHARCVERGVEIICDPEDTSSGRRRCVARDPNGVLVYVTSRRAPAGLSVPQTSSETNHHEDHSYRLRWISCH